MKYALLIHDDEAAWAAMSEEDRNQLLKEYGEFSNDVVERGLMRGGEQLQPSSTATTVRIRDDKTITADGPFAETKEQLGGFYLIECENLDQAIEAAARVPSAKRATIEVRPIVESES